MMSREDAVKRRVVPVSALLFFLALCVCGCEGDRTVSNQSQEIKIGVICPFSGSNASSGEDLKAGYDLALQIINGSFDLSLPLAKEKGLPSHNHTVIRLIYKDSKGDPFQGAEAAEALINRDHAACIIGCYSSTVTAAASERAEIMKVPFLDAVSTSPTLTQRHFKWFFRTTPHDRMFAQNFFAFLTDLRKKKDTDTSGRLVLIYENRLWGTSVAQAERKLAMRHNYEIVEDVPYDSQSGRFDDELRHVKAAMPGVIMQASYASDAVQLMQGYKRLDINPQAILAMNAGFISPYFLETLGKDGEHILSREVWALDLGGKNPLVKTVNELFKDQYGRNMTGNSARAFTGLMVMAEALNRAKAADPEDIRRALLNTELRSDQLIMPWEGVRFDPLTGQNLLGRGIIVQIQDGQYVTVWPWELAIHRLIWPMPRWSERGGTS
jgi:branched-chain amino acid transport system substrate-binding protein